MSQSSSTFRPLIHLRDHPLLTRRSGTQSWPPLWINTRGPRDRPRGEIGILRRAWMAEAIDNAIFLSIEHEGNDYAGAMYFDDIAFCRQLNSILQSKMGVSIKEIGDLDLTHTL